MKIIDFLFGCSHEHTTFPRARKDRQGKILFPLTNYVACLDCGAEIDYPSLSVHAAIGERPATRHTIEADERHRVTA